MIKADRRLKRITNAKTISSDQTPNRAKQRLEAGDVLVSMTRPNLNAIALVPEDLDGAIGSTGFYVLRSKWVAPKFLFYLVQTREFIDQMTLRVQGALYPAVRPRDVLAFTFALPSASTQRRIIAKIDALFSELDKGVESLKTAREQLKVYRQAVLKQALEGKLTIQWRKENKEKLELPEQILKHIQKERDARYEQQLLGRKDAINASESNENEVKKTRKPKTSECADMRNTFLVEIPKEWTCAPIKDLNSDVFDGPFGSHLKTHDYVSEGVRVIRLENIGHLVFVDSKQSFVTFEKYQTIKKHTVHHGDVIVASFVTDSIRAAILPETVDLAINKADCFCLRLYGESVRNDFVAAFLSTRSAYKQIESEVHGVGRPRINTAQLKNFTIPVCSREEQNLIMQLLSEKLSLIENLDSLIDCEIQRCEVLRQSILKKAFSGQLVPQDPNDEPASVLLERIRTEKAAQAKTTKDSVKRRTRVKRAAPT
ncbi:restriction endonuclease subunit S [Thiocapsa rosea]|uniref:Type I restriction enzyme S subunit n=1 Tax=Thiocapsa rosea TaxID=69360 RepID=A0A495VFQ3_9GAMM|nr:restriction endonuclease subunit S [Thiocapsa rosea]RKT47670.1 type I restriction enzyme S subunit [Thiocapsa rosea]